MVDVEIFTGDRFIPFFHYQPSSLKRIADAPAAEILFDSVNIPVPPAPRKNKATHLMQCKLSTKVTHVAKCHSHNGT